MEKKRFKKMMIKNILHVIKLHFCAKRIAKKDKMPYLDRHRYIRKFLYIYHRDMKVKQNVFGIENLNGLEGCVFMGNHQSQEDGPALLKAPGDNDYAAACLINDERTHYFFFSNLCDMLKFKRIKFDDLRSQAKIYNEMKDEINQGYRFIIFPEAGYSDNRNNLQEFNTPAFVPAIKAKCPIVPFVLYDTWRVYNDDFAKSGLLTYEVHFLKPIQYAEYKDLNKQEIANLVKNKILEKLNEIKKEKGEIISQC